MKGIFKKSVSGLLSLIIIFSTVGIFPVSAKKDDVETDADTFRCDWFSDSFIYPFEYDDSYFDGSSFDYNHELATYALCVSMASFGSFDEEHKDGNISDILQKCGYEVTSYGYDTEGYDTVGVAFGRREINIGNEPFTVVIVAVRSGNYGMEWGGNMRIGMGENHLGFDLSKQLVIKYLNEYIAENPIDGKVKMLISGYSRGASIANLVAAELNDGRYVNSLKNKENSLRTLDLTADNLYTYTFEAPRCTKDENAHDSVYSNIFNFVNPNDYVPKFVMSEWGFTHYGAEYNFPSADNCEDYDAHYTALCNEFDSMMKSNGVKAKDCFYDEESSISVNSTWDYFFNKFATTLIPSREDYVEKYENGIVTIAGQYLGQKLGGLDAAKTAGACFVALAIALIPSNYEKIQSDGFKTYLAEKISESDAGAYLSDDEIANMLDLIISFIELVHDNTHNLLSLFKQIKTVIYVHQPYTALSWMRSLTEDDIKSINKDEAAPLKLSTPSLSALHKVNYKIEAEYDKSLGTIVWSSDNPEVASVSDNGVITGGREGTAEVTATLVSADGEVIDSESAVVTVSMNVVQVALYNTKKLFS